MTKLAQQIAFFQEVEQLKTVTRQNQTLDGRFENSAEHSWQLALMAVTLQDYFPEEVDLKTVLTMLLVHDIGEIGPGDTSLFDEVGKSQSYEKERQSVLHTFGKLPDEQAATFLSLWEEFERGSSAEARFARCMDALAPLMNHLFIAKEQDNPDGLTKSQVLAKKAFIEKESPDLWQLILDLLEKSVEKGLYLDQ